MATIINTASITPDTVLSTDERDWVYNGLDCCVTQEILEVLLPQLDSTTSTTYNFSRALQAPILEMTMRGLRVDMVQRDRVVKLFNAQTEQLSWQLNQLITEGLGISAINWSSPKQLNYLFYDVLQFTPVKKRSANGKYVPTTNREALEKLRINERAEPFIAHILALRDLAKKLQFLTSQLDPDGRIRTNLNIAGTNTGRLASSISDYGTGGNLQNVDRDLRSVIIPDPGKIFVNLDLEQGDARNVGAICWQLFVDAYGETFAGSYLDACESGDLHTTVCRMAWRDLDWGSDPAQWRAVAEKIAYRSDSYRQLAKKLGHGTNYYGTPPTMAKHTKVARATIEQFQAKYFGAFQCIPKWHGWVRDELERCAQITTLFGRRRTFFGRPNEDSTLREAIAYAPQSMTGDAINTGLLRVWRENKVELLMQVHDSVLCQVPKEQVNELVPWLLSTLQVKIPLKKDRLFTLPTEAKVGMNWGDYSASNPNGLKKWKP